LGYIDSPCGKSEPEAYTSAFRSAFSPKTPMKRGFFEELKAEGGFLF